jgi:hypothetical protein
MDIMTIVEIGAATIFGAAKLLTIAVRTPDPTTPLGKAYHVVEVIALVIGRAKDTGLIPSNPAVDAAEKDVVAATASVLGKTVPALLLFGALALGLSACNGVPTPAAVVSTVGPLTTALAATPAGQSALAQIATVQAGAAAAVQKANAGLGLTPADVAGLCAIDQALHPVANAIIGSVPGGSIGDDAAYAAAQAACNLEAGQVPSAAQLALLVQEAAAVLGAL